MVVARRPAVTETHTIVGRLIDCQILASYAADAISAANCPENSGPVSVAHEALDKLRAILRAETGRLEAGT